MGKTFFMRYFFCKSGERSLIFYGLALGYSFLLRKSEDSSPSRFVDSATASPRAFSSMSSWAKSKSEQSEDQTVRSAVWDLGRKSSTRFARSEWHKDDFRLECEPNSASLRSQSELRSDECPSQRKKDTFGCPFCVVCSDLNRCIVFCLLMLYHKCLYG